MSRHRPTTKLAVIGQLNRTITNYNDIAEFLVSKENNTNFIKPTNEFAVPDSIESFYANYALEYEQALQTQRTILQQNEENEKLYCLREEELRRDQQVLRERFYEVTKTLKASREKEKRIKNSIHNELIKQKDYKMRIVTTKQNINILQEFLIQIKSTVQEYTCYEELLKEFLEKNPSYRTADSFINRIDALLMSYNDIDSYNTEILQELELHRNEVVKLVRLQTSILMQNKNELDFFVRAYTVTQNEVFLWEEKFKKIKSLHSQHLVERNAMYDGLYNLYLLLCKRRMIQPTIRFNEVSKLCMFIKEEYEVLTGVLINLNSLKICQ